MIGFDACRWCAGLLHFTIFSFDLIISSLSSEEKLSTKMQQNSVRFSILSHLTITYQSEGVRSSIYQMIQMLHVLIFLELKLMCNGL